MIVEGSPVGALQVMAANAPEEEKLAETLLGLGGGTKESALPLPSTAMQKVVVGHETEVRGMGLPEVLVSIRVALVHVDPPQESAFPLWSTAMQNVVVGQETE